MKYNKAQKTQLRLDIQYMRKPLKRRQKGIMVESLFKVQLRRIGLMWPIVRVRTFSSALNVDRAQNYYKALNVANVLPSGVGLVDLEHFSVWVADGEGMYNIRVTCLDSLVHQKHLQRMWLQLKSQEGMEMHCTKLICFEQYLESCRSRSASRSESVA